MMDSSLVVVIPMNRYEELLHLESRVEVAVERLKHSDFFCKEDLLWILGTDEAVATARELNFEAKKEREICLKKLLEEE